MTNIGLLFTEIGNNNNNKSYLKAQAMTPEERMASTNLKATGGTGRLQELGSPLFPDSECLWFLKIFNW